MRLKISTSNFSKVTSDYLDAATKQYTFTARDDTIMCARIDDAHLNPPRPRRLIVSVGVPCPIQMVPRV